MKKYYITIIGNDSFYVQITVEANNIELALARALTEIDAYSKHTIEQLKIVEIKEKNP